MHKLLHRQLKKLKLLPPNDIQIESVVWQKLLTTISDSYEQADASRDMIEHSLTLMSSELVQRNFELKEHLEKLQKNQETIKFQAQHDTLTKLPNRLLFLDRLGHAVDKSKRNQTMAGVLFVDLDRFKKINDTCGHHVGDDLLCDIARRISGIVRSEDTIARFGGDEFVVLLEGMETYAVATSISSRILSAVSDPCWIEGRQFHISASIGISVFPRDDRAPKELIRKADMAMYHAKKNGRNNFQFFSQPLERLALYEADLENRLRAGVENSEFFLVYQPKIDTEKMSTIGFEALIRWNCTENSSVSPMEFIPVAEKTGLIKVIGAWVLEQTCQQLKQWLRQGFNQIAVSVNVSTGELLETDLSENIKNLLDKYDIPPKMLQIEITETVLMENLSVARKTLESLRELGLEIALDDFGTGYSSLSYLQSLPIDYLKIDKSFIQNLHVSEKNQVIANSIVSLGHNLNMEVVAEGAETKEAVDILVDQKCNYIQGYYFYKPLSADEATELLLSQSLKKTTR